MKAIYLKFRHVFQEILQICLGLGIAAFTLHQCTTIDYNFKPGEIELTGVLTADPTIVKSAENAASIELKLDKYPETKFSYSPDHFHNEGLPRIESKLRKGDTVVLKIFLDDYNRHVTRSPTLTEYFVFGSMPIISIRFGRDMYHNRAKPHNQEPNYMMVFLIYTVVCGFIIISAYVRLCNKIDNKYG
jgi:hypothetical protein